MRTSLIHAARWIIVALACAAGPIAAPAQDLGEAAAATAAPSSSPADAAAASESGPLSPDESAMLGHALTLDAAKLANAKPAKPLRLPSLTKAHGLDVSRHDKPDGSSTVVVKQPLPTEWDTHVGADLGLSPTAPDRYRPDKPLPATADGRGSGAAWASMGVPNLATVDARVDPLNEQGKLGATFKRSIPLGDKFSVTLQNGYSVTEAFSPPSAAPSDLPLMAPPTAAAPTPQVWGNEKIAKFDILPSGTTFGAKLASNSTDPVTHNTLSAEQKLYGPLHVTTAVTDVGQPISSKSITAGFKLHW